MSRPGDSPYWTWVAKFNGGVEPRENNPEDLVDPASLEPTESSAYGKKFTAWLSYGMAGLSERQRQVFSMAYIDGRTDAETARALGISLRRVINVKARLREKIAKEIGLPGR